MDLESILTTLNTAGHGGHTISTEEGIVLHNSLLILKNENHFRKIYFWGRIFGIEKDYYISFGYVKDALLGRIYYYSTDCVNWGLMPLPNENGKLLTPFCTSRFQGDPALVIDVMIEKDEIMWEPPLQKPEIRKLKEEDRLTATVFQIDTEAAIVPRGALFKRPDGFVVNNLSFEGLKLLDARELSFYQHYRKPQQTWNTNLLEKDDYNYAMDFLDPIDIDVPEGCWQIRIVNGEQMAVLNTLYWPGFLFWHKIQTPDYGFVYFGSGKKCLDPCFMLFPN